MIARGDLGRGAPLRGGPDRPEAAGPARAGPRRPDDRGDPDARVDDGGAASDAGRGERRGQRGLRWRGRDHAVGRDGGRALSRSWPPRRRSGSPACARRRVARISRRAPATRRTPTSARSRLLRSPWPAPNRTWPAIVCYTRSGWTARMLASLRPPVPVFAFTPSESVVDQLALVHGVVPRLVCRRVTPRRGGLDLLERLLGEEPLVPAGAPVVLIASTHAAGQRTQLPIEVYRRRRAPRQNACSKPPLNRILEPTCPRISSSFAALANTTSRTSRSRSRATDSSSSPACPDPASRAWRSTRSTPRASAATSRA